MKYKRKHPNKRTLKTRRKRKSTRKLKLYGGTLSTVIVFNLDDRGGFFATFWSLCKVYIYAKKNGYPFFINNVNWPYSYKDGWHDYFSSLTKFVKDPKYKNIEYYSHLNFEKIPDYKTDEFIKVIPEIYKLNDEIQQTIDTKITEFGEYSAIYIRKGDKDTEMPLLPTKTILSKTTIDNNAGKVFIQTDDYNVISELQKLLPSCEILSITRSTLTGATHNNIKASQIENRKADTEELFISIGIFLGGKNRWTNYKSNVGVFHKLSDSKVRLYSPNDELETDINKIFDPERIKVWP